jgi:hypothetical protein
MHLDALEPELRAPPPRPLGWTRGAFCYGGVFVEPLEPEVTALLERGTTAVATVVEASEDEESRSFSLYATYLFEVAGRVYRGRAGTCIDPLHVDGSYTSWALDAYRIGSRFTVIFPPGAPRRHRIYGELGLYRRTPLVEVVARLRDERDPARARKHVFDAWALIHQAGRMAPAIQPRVGDAYARFGLLVSRGRLRAMSRVLPLFERALRDPGHDDLLEELNALCVEHAIGLWAAQALRAAR